MMNNQGSPQQRTIAQIEASLRRGNGHTPSGRTPQVMRREKAARLLKDTMQHLTFLSVADLEHIAAELVHGPIEDRLSATTLAGVYRLHEAIHNEENSFDKVQHDADLGIVEVL